MISITGSYLGITNLVLAYDATGNMTCVSAAPNCGSVVNRWITYASFKMT